MLFPYDFRRGQKELMEFVGCNARENACVHAPTGFGKTAAILAALLERGRIVWAVRTGNETDRPVEELKIIREKTGKPLFGMSYRGKKDMCLLARESGLHGANHEDVSLLCGVQRGKCEYYGNLRGFDVSTLCGAPTLYSEVLRRCAERKVCPYFAQRQMLAHADMVSLSYNYVISREMGSSIRSAMGAGDVYAVIDEAHNLQSAASSLNSDSFNMGTFHYALLEMERVENAGSGASRCVTEMRKSLAGYFRQMTGDEAEFDVSEFAAGVHGLETNLPQLRKYGNAIRRVQAKEGKNPHSSLHRLAEFWQRAIEAAGTDGVAHIARKEKTGFFIDRADMRSAEILRGRWGDFAGCVFCSGTLEPVDAFAETAGLAKYRAASFDATFSKDRVKTVIAIGLSTKGKAMSDAMLAAYVSAIGKFAGGMDANIAVFTCSYRVQTGLLSAGLRRSLENAGKKVFCETQGMRGDEARRLLDDFKSCAGSDVKGALVASAAGRFAEGADFPGRELEGIFMAGIPFDRLCVRTSLCIDYYKRLYGDYKGTHYAYVIPAMRRTAQSLGRALRSGEDAATLVLGDERYAEPRFFSLLPGYARSTATHQRF